MKFPDSNEAAEFEERLDSLAGGAGWAEYLRVIDVQVAASPLSPEVKEAIVTRVSLFNALWWREPLHIVQPLLQKYLSYELSPLAPFRLGTVVCGWAAVTRVQTGTPRSFVDGLPAHLQTLTTLTPTERHEAMNALKHCRWPNP